MKFQGKVRVNPRIKSVRELAKLDTSDMKRMLLPLDSAFSKNEARQFSSQGSSGGKRWPALSPEYAKFKRKAKPGRKIMTFSGKMRNAFKNRNNPDHVATFSMKPRPRLEVGARSRIAAYHAKSIKGNPLASSRLPDRNVIQQTALQMKGYSGLMKDYLVNTKLARVRRALQAGGAW